MFEMNEIPCGLDCGPGFYGTVRNHRGSYVVQPRRRE